MAGGKPYFGGIPTDIDVRRMRESFPKEALKPGKMIPYAEVEKVISVKHHECRFKTVTNRWRRLMENEMDIVIGCVRAGFIVKDDHDMVDMMGSKLRSAIRSSKRAIIVGSRVDTKNLTDEERKQFHHNEMRAGTMLATSQMRKPKELPEL